MIKSATRFFGKKSNKSEMLQHDNTRIVIHAGRKDSASATPQELAQAFLLRHKAANRRFNIEAGPSGFLLRGKSSYKDRGLAIELHADANLNYRSSEFSQLNDVKAAQAWLSQVHTDLSQRVKHSVEQAEGALRALCDFALRESELRWLGGESAVRTKYLQFPSELPVSEATATARQRHRDMQADSLKEKLVFLKDRVKQLRSAKINGRTISQRYAVVVPLLTSSLELEIDIEKSLELREIDRLLAEPETTFSASIESMFSEMKKAQVKKMEDQVRELGRRIKALPHITLLSDSDIAATVAPYYGGLNRALKKRHARSALVAVEEQAREAKYQDDVIKLNEQRDAYADVASYYPIARSLNRQLILYVGPTNSGKTWRSLNELAEAGSGAYLAPLRLLALEGQEELEKRGKICSFLTGEERDLKPGAQYVSSTIEMLNTENQLEAVVIDEVQMLGDERRGWAWLAAVVGAPAKKVIMTGSPDCVEIVKDLAAYLGEELIIHECQRYNELRVAPMPMRLGDIRPGMAVVCFSRRDVLHIKAMIQENSKHQVAVVYGNLSPQIRREEARRFRSGEADILVATDAIAMGLNLPITEVLFYKTEKFNGEEVCPLTPSEIRQIAGRAGRFGVAQFGVVNALNTKNLNLIREALSGTSQMLAPPYFVAPGHNHVRIISNVLGTNSLERVLTFFDRAIEFSDQRFSRSNIDDLSYLSTFVDEQLPFLDVTEKLTIASAPVGIRNETVVNWFLNRMLPTFSDPAYPKDTQGSLDELFEAADRFGQGTARSQIQLRDAEDYLKTLTVYAWLAYRYPDVFTRIADCEERREAVNAFIEKSLKVTVVTRCSSCDATLSRESNSRKCKACRDKERQRYGERRRRSGDDKKRVRRRR